MATITIHRPARREPLRAISYTATESVQAAIEGIGRTEDVRFSPDFSNLAILGFNANKILILSLEISRNVESQPIILLKDFLEIGCDRLKKPHGAYWINDNTLIVANREGAVDIFALPSPWPTSRQIQLDPIQTIHCDMLDGLDSPGSVALRPLGDGLHEVFICNNYKHFVSQHILDESDHYRIKCSSMLLRQDLEVPDGISLSRDGRWIAISNHDRSLIHIYQSTANLSRLTQPVAILGGLKFPHGIRFTVNSKALIAADAGAPYLHIYSPAGPDWSGYLEPIQSYQIMDDAMFLRGQVNPEEGGPKGIDIEPRSNVLVASCEEQPLAFFDLNQMLIKLPENSKQLTAAAVNLPDAGMQRAIMMRHISALSEAKMDLISLQLKQQQEFESSTSWRLTAPLRIVGQLCYGLQRAARSKQDESKRWIHRRQVIWGPRIRTQCRNVLLSLQGNSPGEVIGTALPGRGSSYELLGAQRLRHWWRGLKFPINVRI